MASRKLYVGLSGPTDPKPIRSQDAFIVWETLVFLSSRSRCFHCRPARAVRAKEPIDRADGNLERQIGQRPPPPKFLGQSVAGNRVFHEPISCRLKVRSEKAVSTTVQTA